MSMSMKNLYYDILKVKLQTEEQHNSYNERNFLLCRSCFWCASVLNGMHSTFSTCPSCMNSVLESMPLSFDEKYTFDYDPRQGATLGFSIQR